ncbi:50S ribosomal protein L32 [Candidatus Falkowbacteria bacterium CG_4_10_14_0_2_um_filter_48_10]|uniref:Large ribosomal subunit protein bL32 n=1 Tax=Candidatus Falkowbacteria bacterium CG23_combo_of_CG06-09_8_20_14_all_49_15 TaxID=1974572 RepID=A0A2G9ZKJ6_9BACT|nr:MAG: 50S ribosomal protein L32 [Candidatus Falkowbacteria bacterium CG23_combo_of_CG06-09_8_20_14_all_49_15]PJA08395.1 MAG: 50S ribosomal protein L32 [Candidatus Falkowbacteria bacterium CG_4_10_14_0_2_um_filter_48_10]
MSVPMKRHPSSKAGRRRSHLALKPVFLAKCPQCGRAVKPYQACAFCGFYKGRTAVKVKIKKEKKSKKA